MASADDQIHFILAAGSSGEDKESLNELMCRMCPKEFIRFLHTIKPSVIV